MRVPAPRTINSGTLLNNIYGFKLSSSGMNIRKVNTDVEFLDILSNWQGSVQLKVHELPNAFDIVENPRDVGGLEVFDIHAELTSKMNVHSLVRPLLKMRFG
jgi:hypothetical protein